MLLSMSPHRRVDVLALAIPPAVATTALLAPRTAWASGAGAVGFVRVFFALVVAAMVAWVGTGLLLVDRKRRVRYLALQAGSLGVAWLLGHVPFVGQVAGMLAWLAVLPGELFVSGRRRHAVVLGAGSLAALVLLRIFGERLLGALATTPGALLVFAAAAAPSGWVLARASSWKVGLGWVVAFAVGMTILVW